MGNKRQNDNKEPLPIANNTTMEQEDDKNKRTTKLRKGDSSRKLLNKSDSKRKLTDKTDSRRKLDEKSDSKSKLASVGKAESKRKLLSKGDGGGSSSSSKSALGNAKAMSTRKLVRKSSSDKMEGDNRAPTPPLPPPLPSSPPFLSSEHHKMAIKALALIKLYDFQCAKSFEKEVKARCGGTISDKDVDEAMSRLEETKSPPPPPPAPPAAANDLGSHDLRDSIHGRPSKATVPANKKKSSPVQVVTNKPKHKSFLDDSSSSDDSDASSSSSSGGGSDGSELKELHSSASSSADVTTPGSPTLGVQRKVSFNNNVALDQFEPFSPKKKNTLFYSKEEIMQFKSEDQAEKEVKRAKERAERKRQQEKEQAEKEKEISRAQKEQLAKHKKKLKNDSKKREEEWKKQQEQAEAMERMMKESMAAFSFKL